MKIRLILLLLFGFAVGSYGLYNYFTGWQWAFKQSPALVFYSLNPEAMITATPVVPLTQVPDLIVDKVVVSDEAEKQRLIGATHQAFRQEGMMTMSHCFAPHYAVSTSDGTTVVLICFDCGQAKVITPRGSSTDFVNRKAQPLFDALIKQYGLKFKP